MELQIKHRSKGKIFGRFFFQSIPTKSGVGMKRPRNIGFNFWISMSMTAITTVSVI